MVELSITPYKFKHFQYVIDLHKSQNSKDTPFLEHVTLPKIGYVVFLGKEPVACGFLRRLEPCFAQIDTLATSAYFGSSVRNDAINIILKALFDDAKRIKLKGMICHTADKGILSRAESLGFITINQQIIVKTL